MSPVWPGYRDHAGPGVTEVGVLNPLRVLGPVPGDALNLSRSRSYSRVPLTYLTSAGRERGAVGAGQ